MATYVNDLRLKEIGTGESSGTWGSETNTNLELIAEAFSFGTEAITTNADTHTTTIADGSTDPGRSIFLKYTGALDSDCTITIGPNTVSKLWFIENATTDSGSSGPYNIVIKQGTGATVTVPNSHVKAIYSDGAGSGGAMVEALTDLNLTDSVTISGSTPTLTIGDAGAEDTKIVFDGNAQDFYMGLDDSADDLVIGLGSAVGTTPAIEIDENQDIKFAQSIGVGQAASSTTGDIAAQTMSLLGTTPTLTLGDGGEEDVAIKFNGVKDFYIANDDSADKLVIGEGSTVGTNNILTITDDTVTLGDGAAADTALVFDGNAKDFYVALDDSADKLVIGEGSTVGTNNILTITDDTVTLGDGAAVDTSIVFDGNAQDFYVALDDSADDLLVGVGSTVGSSVALSIDENQVVTAETSANIKQVALTDGTVSWDARAAANAFLLLEENSTISAPTNATEGAIIQIEVAQTALAGIFTGETESLKKLGIMTTEATLKNNEYFLSLGKSFSELTQLEKIQIRYAEVLRQSTNAVGDFERTSEGFANQIQEGNTGRFVARNDAERKEKKELRDSNISWIDDWWLKKEILPYVQRANEKAGWNFKLTTSESAQFTIYDNKQHYWWHRDARQYPYYDNDFPNLIRKLSVTVSLSHPKEYEGGYLQFAATRDWGDTFKLQCTEILPRGSICVFPSYTWHRVSPVTKGRRLSLVQWNLGEGYV